MKIETILVPTDFSPDATTALETAKGLARQLGCRIVLLHAYRVDLPHSTPDLGGGFVLPDRFYEELGRSATKKVEELAEGVAKDGISASGIAVEDRPASAILDAAKRIPADLIVMGSRGLTGLAHVLLGSVADRVIRQSTCPVLVARSKT